MSPPILIKNARLLTMCGADGSVPGLKGRRGADVGTLGIKDDHDLLVLDGRIAEITPAGAAPSERRREAMSGCKLIDAHRAVVMPGFVDAHTHACWAGSRLDEWERKLKGATYLEIMASGGGIMSTVRAVREASVGELACDLLMRLGRLVGHGTTTAEVKSGYGLTTEHELKMLEAITQSRECSPGGIVATALLGHAIDGDERAFVDRTINETLPAVSAAHPGVAVDAYCERGAWSVDDTTRLLEAASDRGHPVRVHADQFTALGMLDVAIGLGARSVDHLEASTPEGLAALARSETFGVMLPACGFHLDSRYGKGRAFLDAGGKLALATNLNPGSAPCSSMPMVIALAVRHMGLSVAEAIGATTSNAAALLGLSDRGYLAAGARADLIMLAHEDERELGYEIGGNPVELVIIGGRVIE